MHICKGYKGYKRGEVHLSKVREKRRGEERRRRSSIRYTLYAIRYTLYAIRYTLYAIRYTAHVKIGHYFCCMK